MSFTPEKRPELDNLAKTKSPVKMEDFRRNLNFGRVSYVIDNNTTFIELTNVDFERSTQIDTFGIVSIVALFYIALEEQVTVKAKVVKQSGVKKQSSRGTMMNKQDPSGSISG